MDGFPGFLRAQVPLHTPNRPLPSSVPSHMADDLHIPTPSHLLTTANDPHHITNTPDTTPKRTQKIKLNVGGEYFVTSLDTLLRFDEGYFAGLLRSGREPETDDGAYFIDRDPAYFRKILNYMRTGFLEEGHGAQRHSLQLELAYFSIPKPTLLERYEKVFNGWMSKSTGITVEWDSNDPSTSFDECLKDLLETPTIVIAETNEGEVFGGYSNGWSTHQTCWPEKSWLFNLSNTSGLPPMQFFFADDNPGQEVPPLTLPSSRGISFGSHVDGTALAFYCSNGIIQAYTQKLFPKQLQCLKTSGGNSVGCNYTRYNVMEGIYFGAKYLKLNDVCPMRGAPVHLQVWKRKPIKNG